MTVFNRRVDVQSLPVLTERYRGYHVSIIHHVETSPPLLEKDGRTLEVLGVEPDIVKSVFKPIIFKSKATIPEELEDYSRAAEFETAQEALVAAKKKIDDALTAPNG